MSDKSSKSNGLSDALFIPGMAAEAGALALFPSVAWRAAKAIRANNLDSPLWNKFGRQASRYTLLSLIGLPLLWGSRYLDNGDEMDKTSSAPSFWIRTKDAVKTLPYIARYLGLLALPSFYADAVKTPVPIGARLARDSILGKESSVFSDFMEKSAKYKSLLHKIDDVARGVFTVPLYWAIVASVPVLGESVFAAPLIAARDDTPEWAVKKLEGYFE